jgi:hypothetical protein
MYSVVEARPLSDQGHGGPAYLAGPATALPGFRAAGGMESYMSVQEMAENRGVTRIPPAGPVVGRLP